MELVQSKKFINPMLRISLLLIFLVTTGVRYGDAAQGGTGAKYSFLRLSTDTLELISDAGEPQARRALARMQQMERLLGQRRTHIRAYLFKDDRWFGDLRPVPTAQGFYQSAAERDYLAVIAGPEGLRALSHEFVHASLEHTTARRPVWLEEGVAEFYSTVALERDRWVVGRPIENHVRALRQVDWLTPRELFGIGKDSSVYNEGNRVGVFYAQSWAFVHFLYTQPGYREKIAEFAELLDEGVPAEEACLRAFRRSARDVLEEARQRLLRGQFPVAELAGEALEAPLVRVDTVGEEVVAELALARGKIALARRLYQRQGSATALGLLALAQGDRESAGRYFDQAVGEGAPESTPYFEVAMLRRDAKQPFEPLLRQAVERNPRHAEAWFLLGLEAAKREQWEDAVEAYQRATAILPRQANFWHGMAMALRRAGRPAEASRAALKCKMAASSAAEREMAAALIALVSAPPARSAVRGAAVIIPDSWEGLRGDAISDGLFEELVCADPAVMKVVPVGELRVLRPKEIRITGGPTELACGLQQRKVRVGYIQATREVVSVEFLP